MTATIHYLPPRHDEAERLGDAWRITRADLAEDIMWIRTYGRYLTHGAMTPSYRRYVENALAGRVRSYLAALRQAHLHETRMDAMGVEFNRSN